MADREIRTISVQVEGTQAYSQLIKIGGALDALGPAVGKGTGELKKLDRQLTTAVDKMAQGARAIGRLKFELKEMSKANTAANNTINRLGSRITTANKRLAEQRQIVTTQKSVIAQLVRENGKLAQSQDRVAAAATKAANATNSIRPTMKLGNELSVNASGQVVQPQRMSGGGVNYGNTVPLNTLAKDTEAAAKGAQKLATGMDQAGQFTNALRYQLYDVAATFGVMGAALTASGAGFFGAGIEWEKNFANVIRTSQVTGQAVAWLREEFLQLQTVLPVTSSELAEIATLGAQMGVSADKLANFTEITAKFSATSGMSVDESATALSRLNQLLPDVEGNYERLASTILKTGVNAVATEQQIVRGTNQIASLAQIAGLTTPEIVALASAMSSLGFSPELQRSIITSSFSRIMTATSEVTERTEKFGAVLNMTGKQFQEAWRSDALGTYQNFLKSLASRGDAVTVLQDLSLASQRLTPNLLKLGQNTGVLDAALSDTTSEWKEIGEMTWQYGVISETVAARLQVLGQTWEALLTTLNDSDTFIKPLIDGLTGFLGILRDIAKTPGVATIASLATAIITLTGVMALGAAGLAALGAGYIAIFNANIGLKAAIAADTAARIGNTAAVGANTVALGGNTVAMNANTGAAIANSGAMAGLGGRLLRVTSGIIGSLPAILAWTGAIGAAVAGVAGLAVAIGTAPTWTWDLGKMFQGITGDETVKYNVDALKAVAEEIGGVEEEVRKLDAITKRGVPMISDIEVDPAARSRLSELIQIRERAIKDLEEYVIGLDSVEKQLDAVNYFAKEYNITSEEALALMPDLSSAIGEGAAAMADARDEAIQLQAAQELWAASLNTSDENLSKLRDGVKGAAEDFLGFGEALEKAYDTSGEEGTGGGLSAFFGSMNEQIADFESFYGNLGTLIRNGGVQLATFFAEQGPGAAQALTDSLALDSAQLSQIEEQFALAAFYASDAFADTFAQNNSILAEVWRQTKDTDAVAAFNSALANSMKGGSIDPAVLAELADKFGVEINTQLVPTWDPDAYDTEIALLEAKIKPVTIQTGFRLGPNDRLIPETMKTWIVEMESNTITMDVDPNTEEGQRLLREWRANEYNTPVELQTFVNTSQADIILQDYLNRNRTLWINARVGVGGFSMSNNAVATGGLVNNGQILRQNYPGFANGTIVRGAGTGTSDSIIARLSNGEAVTRARAVRYYGTRMMEDINNLRFPKFASGYTPRDVSSTGAASTPRTNVVVNQYYPTTRDPLKQLREDSENLVAGLWGGQ